MTRSFADADAPLHLPTMSVTDALFKNIGGDWELHESAAQKKDSDEKGAETPEDNAYMRVRRVISETKWMLTEGRAEVNGGVSWIDMVCIEEEGVEGKAEHAKRDARRKKARADLNEYAFAIFAFVNGYIIKEGAHFQEFVQKNTAGEDQGIIDTLDYYNTFLKWRLTASDTEHVPYDYANYALSALLEFMLALIPPFTNDPKGPLPDPVAGSSSLIEVTIDPADMAKVIDHWSKSYATLKAVADLCVNFLKVAKDCVLADDRTEDAEKIQPKLDTLDVHRPRDQAANFSQQGQALVTGGDDAEEKVLKLQRKALLRHWYLKNDWVYRQGFDCEHTLDTYDNMGGGNCGYASFIAALGTDGRSPDPGLGLESAGNLELVQTVRNEVAEWLRGPGPGQVQADPDSHRWVQFIKDTKHFLTCVEPEPKYGLNAWYHYTRDPTYNITCTPNPDETWDEYSERVDEGYQRWVLETQHTTGTLPKKQKGHYETDIHWATFIDWYAMAYSFKRRIHIYTVKNPPGKPRKIEKFKHFESFGDIKDPPVCIAYTSGDRRVGSQTDTIDTRHLYHFVVILNKQVGSESYDTPRPKGLYSNVLLPYRPILEDPLYMKRPGPVAPQELIAPTRAEVKRMYARFAELFGGSSLQPPLAAAGGAKKPEGTLISNADIGLLRSAASRKEKKAAAKAAEQQIEDMKNELIKKWKEYGKANGKAKAGEGPPPASNTPAASGSAGLSGAAGRSSRRTICDGVLDPSPNPSHEIGTNGGGGGPHGGNGDEGGEGDSLRSCGGAGGVPVRDNQYEANRYNYVDAFLSPYQIEFVKKKMYEAHNAFVQHMANRQNYGNVMLMRTARPDALVNDDGAHKYNPRLRQNTKQITTYRNKLWAELGRVHPSYHTLIWEDWEALSENQLRDLSCGHKNQPQLKEMISHLFALASFTEDGLRPEEFWVNLCKWWVQYNGEEKYALGNYSTNSRFARTRNELLRWIVTQGTNQETEKDGAVIKSFWCFMNRSVEKLRDKLPEDKKGNLNVKRMDIAEALSDFTMRTKGAENKTLRKTMADSEWFGSRLFVELSSMEGDDATTVARNLEEQLENLGRVLRRGEQEMRATEGELNAALTALQNAMSDARNLWMEKRKDSPDTVDGVTNQLAYAQFLLMYTDARNQDQSEYKRLKSLVKQANGALAGEDAANIPKAELLTLFYNLQATIVQVYKYTPFADFKDRTILMEGAVAEYKRNKAIKAKADKARKRMENTLRTQREAQIAVAAAEEEEKAAEEKARAAALAMKTAEEAAEKAAKKAEAKVAKNDLKEKAAADRVTLAAAVAEAKTAAEEAFLQQALTTEEAKEANKRLVDTMKASEVASEKYAKELKASQDEEERNKSMDQTDEVKEWLAERKSELQRTAQAAQAAQAAIETAQADVATAKRKHRSYEIWLKKQEEGDDGANEQYFTKSIKAARLAVRNTPVVNVPRKNKKQQEKTKLQEEIESLKTVIVASKVEINALVKAWENWRRGTQTAGEFTGVKLYSQGSTQLQEALEKLTRLTAKLVELGALLKDKELEAKRVNSAAIKAALVEALTANVAQAAKEAEEEAAVKAALAEEEAKKYKDNGS